MKGIKKQNLPQKICIVCNKPFTWRKKWEKVWEEVIYCSERCRKQKNAFVVTDINGKNKNSLVSK